MNPAAACEGKVCGPGYGLGVVDVVAHPAESVRRWWSVPLSTSTHEGIIDIAE